MPNGDLFFTGANAGYGPNKWSWREPGIWNPNTNQFRPVTGGLQDRNEMETAGSLLLPPAQDQRYAIIGGGGVGQSPLSTGRIDVVDLKSKDPRWRPDGKLPTGTRYPEVVITPNDGVVISGGSKYYRGMHASDLMTAHMWMPNTGAVTSLADPLVGRDYHSEGPAAARRPDPDARRQPACSPTRPTPTPRSSTDRFRSTARRTSTAARGRA